jgi:hypothetical protein
MRSRGVEPDSRHLRCGARVFACSRRIGVAGVDGLAPHPVRLGRLKRVDVVNTGQSCYESGTDVRVELPWSGSESDRLASQIDQMRGWSESSTEPEGVKSWARAIIPGLAQQRESALRREAEEDYT